MANENSTFFEFYESAHQDRRNRIIHHVAHAVAIAGLLFLPINAVVTLAAIAVAFLLSWTGHYCFERNTPAFFETGTKPGVFRKVAHHVRVAVGGLVWTVACLLRAFGFGPLAR